MPTTLHLMGLQLGVADDGTVQAPPLTAPVTGSTLTGHIDSVQNTLDIAGEVQFAPGFRLILELHVTVTLRNLDWFPVAAVPHSTGRFIVWPQVQPLPNQPPRLTLNVPPFAFVDDWDAARIKVASDELYVVFTPQTFTADPPLELTGAPAVTMRVRNGSAALVFMPGSFTATASATWLVQVAHTTAQWPAHTLKHASYEVAVELAAPSSAELRFAPDDPTALLALGVEHAVPGSAGFATPENPIVAGHGVRNHDLVAQLSSTGPSTWQIMKLHLEPTRSTRTGVTPPGAPNVPMSVYIHSLSNAANHPVELLTDEKVLLQIRPLTRDRCASLHIASEHAAGIPVRMAQAEGGKLTVHGFVEHTEFDLPDTARLVCTTRDGSADAATFAADLQVHATLPYLEFGAGAGVRVAKPAFHYVDLAHRDSVSTLSFSGGPSLRVPATRSAVLANLVSADPLDEHLKDLDKPLADHTHTFPARVDHESGLIETPAGSGTAKLEPLFRQIRGLKADSATASLSVTLPRTIVPAGDVKLQAHEIVRDFVIVSVHLHVPPGDSLDYAIITRQDQARVTITPRRISPDVGFTVTGNFAQDPAVPPSPTDVIAVVKLTQKTSLAEIFAGEPSLKNLTYDSSTTATPTPTPMLELIDGTIKTDMMWIGIVLFNVELGFDGSDDEEIAQLLQGILPGAPLQYLAVAPGYVPGAPNVAGAFHFANRNTTTATLQKKTDEEKVDPNEATFRLDRLEASWYDTSLNTFNAEARLMVPSFFGRARPAVANDEIVLVGTYDRKTGRIGLAGRLPKPKNLIPAEWANGGFPIKVLNIESLEVRWVDKSAAIVADGSIELQDYDLGGVITLAKLGDISFKDLRIVLPTNITGYDGQATNRVRFSYPSFQFKFDVPPFGLGPFRLKLQSLWVDFSKSFDWGRTAVFQIGPPLPPGASLVMNLRLELMKLPELALKGVDRLILDLFCGFDLSGAAWSHPHVGVAAFSFDGLHLDIMRFLEIDAEELVIFTDTNAGTTTRWIGCEKAHVAVLGRTIIPNFSFFFFTTDGETGFVGYLTHSESTALPTLGFLSVQWVLVGHNVALADDAAKRLVAIDADTDKDKSAKILDVLESIRKKHEIAPIVPGVNAPVNAGRWVFAAALTFADFIEVKFLFADGSHYGIELSGPIFEKLFGYKFAISVLYNKAPTPSEDSFDIAVRVPPITLGPIRFTGGVIELEIVMNGGFTIDIGFPRLEAGIRNWARALGAIVTPYQGSGGVYFQKHTGLRASKKWFEVAAGYAVQFGLGASSGSEGSVFRVWVTVGVYAAIEGRGEWLDGGLSYLQLTGTIGIVVRGGAELNFWIISAHIEITLGAEAQVTLMWGTSYAALPDSAMPAVASQSSAPARLRFDATVYASAHADACIGGGWFKICVSISVTVSLHYAFEFNLS